MRSRWCSYLLSKHAFVSGEKLFWPEPPHTIRPVGTIASLLGHGRVECCAHEEKTSVPAGIGKPGAGPGGRNDAILYQWQRYAGKFSEKTLDRHLSAIRQFEHFLGGKPFETLTLEDGHAFRDHLKSALKPGAEAPKSPSTVQHAVSHLKDFLAWLGKQKGYRTLPRDLPDALDMPRSVYAKALPRAPRTYPDLAEAEALLTQMPKYRAIDLRNRAIFALAFLGALRADALISLRLGDVDCATRRIIQDGRASRTKNGKSLVIAWFPIPEAFEEAVCAWVALMARAGFAPEDALFPQERAFTGYRKASGLGPGPVPAMTSTHAVTHAFRVACRNQHAKYSPHAAKHTIAAERDKRALTAAERKAWSQNMGHENEQITDTHYGKLTDAQRFDLLETPSQQTGQAAQRAFTDAEKIALVDGVMKELTARGR